MLHVVGSCSAKFETGQKFEPTSPNISFVPWSPKRSATMLDQFTQLFQHCQSHARVFHMVSFKLQFLIRCILPKMHSVSGPKIVGVVASVYRCSFMRLNDAFFLCPQKLFFLCSTLNWNWWNPYYLRRIWSLLKLDLNLQENCPSYLFIILSPVMRR